jgi:hypothetical protein
MNTGVDVRNANALSRNSTSCAVLSLCGKLGNGFVVRQGCQQASCRQGKFSLSLRFRASARLSLGLPSKFYPKGKIRRFFEERERGGFGLLVVPYGLIFNPFRIF